MTKAGRQENARLNQLKAQQRGVERRRRLLIAGGALTVVTLIIVAVVVAALTSSKQVDSSAKTSGAVSSGVTAAIAGIPVATFDAIGSGTADTRVLTAAQGDPLTKDGKPRVVYVGAEYCPYCASERWALVAALERFGHFTGLAYAVSSPTDQPPSVPTLSLKDATYTSSYLSFDAYEIQDRNGAPLQTEPDDLKALQAKFGGSSIPWVYFAGQAVQSGSSVDGNLLLGRSQDQVATTLADPSSDLAKSVDGAANLVSAQLCRLTGNQPGAVCTSSGVTTAAAKLP